jgi:uncharacterized membrane protein
MFRKLFGFAIFAVVAILALKVVFGLLGMAIGLLMTVLWFAAIGFFIYMILKLIAPGTADRIKEMITGKPLA